MKISELKITKPVDKNWGIPRSQMPQIKTSDYPEFLDYLDSNGVKFNKQTVPADSLKPIQGEFSDAGVEKALNKRKLDKPSIVSSDDHIIDGHHRWLAALNTKQDVNIYKTNIPAHELLDLVHDFPEVYYKDMYENEGPENSVDNVAEDLSANAELYVDMDGVLVDFFGGWEKLIGVDSWRNIKNIEPALEKIRQQKDFWINLPMTSNGLQLLSAIKAYKGKYNILSAPLPGDKNSEPQKRAWIKKNLSSFPPEKIIIDHNKAAYATQPDGTPNGLIDDFGQNVSKWEAAGGIAIKHNDLKIDRTISKLDKETSTPSYSINEAEEKSIVTSDVRSLGKIFKSNKHELRIVGGAVRDVALGKTPKDIDFATDATPTEMQAMFDKAKIKHIPTGIEHGTITAVINGEPYEITTLRADKETDGRHAEVEFVRSWEEDAKRRDLTYNAMSMDLDGEIYDYFGGMDDLQDRVSRFVGEPADRIKEDYLRILRYFRFQSKMDNPNWSPTELKAIKENVKGLAGVSVERVWQEISKLLVSPSAAEALKAMGKTGVADIIGLPVNNANKVKFDNPIMALSILVDKSDIAKKWKMSNEQYDELNFYVEHKGVKFTEQDTKNMLVDGVNVKHIAGALRLQGQDALATKALTWNIPTFPITGQDLINIGMKPGPDFGKQLAALKDKWKANDFKFDKDELLADLKKVQEDWTDSELPWWSAAKSKFHQATHKHGYEKLAKAFTKKVQSDKYYQHHPEQAAWDLAKMVDNVNVRAFIRYLRTHIDPATGEPLMENVEYKQPQFDVEWEEANRYPFLDKMGEKAWIELAQTGQILDVDDTIVNMINNTDAGKDYRNDTWDELEEPKKERFEKAFKTGKIELPIVMKDPDGRLELIAGNTRLTGLMKHNGEAKVWFIDSGNRRKL